MKKLILKSLLSILGAGILLLTAFFCIFANLTFGVVFTGLLGLSFLLWGIFYEKVAEYTHDGLGKFLKIIVIIFIVFETCLVSFLAIYGQIDNVDYNEDVVMVLGAGVKGNRPSAPLELRLLKAIDYHKKNPDAYLVVTGGMGNGERLNEADVMKNYLMENGIDGNKILKETESTSTKENMQFSKKVIDTYLSGDYSVVVITNDFHMYRSMFLAKKYGFEEVHRMHTGLNWYNILPCYLRESLAIFKSLIFD